MSCGDTTGYFRLARLIGERRRKGHAQTEEVLHAEWVSVDRLKTVSVRPLERAFVFYYERQRRAVLDAINERVKTRKQDPILELIFDVNFWNQILARDFPPLWTVVMGDGFDTGLARVGAEGISFNVQRDFPRQILDEVTELTKGINDTTAGILDRIVRDGLLEEAGWDTIADRISSQFQDWKRSRALTVARTSGTATFEAGQEVAFEEAGVGKKRWLSQRDRDVRGRDDDGLYDHWTPDGDEVDVGSPFLISGEELRFPADPAGSPGNTINCRCTSLPVIR